MSDIDFQDAWRQNYASLSCMEFTWGSQLNRTDWPFVAWVSLIRLLKKPLWKIFIKTGLAFSSEKTGLRFCFGFTRWHAWKRNQAWHRRHCWKIQQCASPPTDVPGDTAGSLSSRCIMFVRLHADVSRVEQTESWSRHSSVNTYKSVGIVSWSPR